MVYQRILFKCGQQIYCEAFQSISGFHRRGFVEVILFHGAARQDFSVQARNQVLVFVQHHIGQRVRLGVKQQHLAFDRRDFRRMANRRKKLPKQLSGPGACANKQLIDGELAGAGGDGGNAVLFQGNVFQLALLNQTDAFIDQILF